jgi:hypothetical protein
MISVRVGGLYRYESKLYPSLGLWRHKRVWQKRRGKSPRPVLTYAGMGTVKHNETFVVLSINHLGEPLILTSGSSVGLIYANHMRMKEIAASEIPVKG